MSALILPSRFKQQPQYPAPIDRRGIGERARFVLIGAQPKAIITGTPRTGAAGTSAATPGGIGYVLPGSVSTWAAVIPGIDPAISGAFSVFWHGVFSDNTAQRLLRSAGSTNGWSFGTTAAGAGQVAFNLSSLALLSGFNSAGIASAENTIHSVAIVYDPTIAAVELFFDGVSVQTGVWGADVNPMGSGQTFSMFSPGAKPHKMLTVQAYEGKLSARDVRSLSDNPWQIFKAPPRKLWAVSDTTNYTLQADSASFALTGTAASLEYHRLLAATQGSFAVNATAATLKRGYALQADSASFALSGTDAGLKYDRVLQAGSVSSQIAGTDASLEYNRVLSAESGSFQIVGTDATFVHDAPGSYTLSAESASFGIAAQPATLKYNRRLSADSGSLAFTGSAASLRYARAVIAEAAVYALTGTDANFRRTGGPEPIVSTVERTAIFRAAVERAATFQRSKQVNARFN